MRVLLALALFSTVDAVFQPTTNAQLKTAVSACIAENSVGYCPTFAGTTVNVGEGSGTYGLIGTWDVSQVTDMTFMFQSASAFNQDLSAWDVSKVTVMQDVFSGASAFNQDLSAWNVSNVITMLSMFKSTSAFNQDLSAWDVGKVTRMEKMFYVATAFNQDLSAWDVGRVTDMDRMFSATTAFNQDLSAWDVGRVTSMQMMFAEASAFNGDLSAWNVSKVTTTFSMFQQASAFNQDLSAWDVGRVTTMTMMFYLASAFNQDLSAWDVSQVTSMAYMFKHASTFNFALCGAAWVDSAANQNNMFISSSGSIAGSTCVCPYNLCLDDTHSTGGVCNAGTCTCPVSLGGDRCERVACPPGTQAVGNVCVECPTDQMSAYDSTCGASCAGSLTPVGKKCVFQLADYAALKTAVDACIVEDATGACPSYEPIGFWDVSQVTDMAGVTYTQAMFSGASSFNADISAWDVSSVTSMINMFYQASAFNQDLSAWDVSSVTNIESMFLMASAFNQDLSTWDVSSVTNMDYIFYLASVFNQDLSGWDVSKVTSMEMMFMSSAFNQDLSAWDVSKVTNMNNMFKSTSAFNYVLCGDAWVDSTATQTGMFDSSSGSIAATKGTCTNNCPYNLCLNQTHNTGGVCSNYQCTCPASLGGDRCERVACPPGTQAVGQTCVACPDEEMSSYDSTCGASCGSLARVGKKCVFQPANKTVLTTAVVECLAEDATGACPSYEPIRYWDVSRVTDMQYMFNSAASFNQDLSAWDVSSVTDMKQMFSGAASFNQVLSAWDVSSVTDMKQMFSGAASFNQDLSAWDVSSVTDMKQMFITAAVFKGDLSAWDVSSVTDMSNMFLFTAFNGDLSAWDVSSVIDMNGMFDQACSFNGDLSAWDVRNVERMDYMFGGASSFNQDVSRWDVSSVVNMQWMFESATSFDQDISAWNVGKVTNLNNMFANTSFQYDLSAWDVGNVNQMNEMFHGTNYSFTLCGDAWVNSAANRTNMGTNITGPCPDSCPYNLCRNITHATGGVCAAGVCTCPIPVEGRRCDAACPGNRYNFADGCDTCIPGFAKTGGACRNASVSESEYLAAFKAGKTKSARAKAVRNALRPMRDTKKTLKENTVSVPMVTADLSDAQLVLIQEIEAKIGGTVELKMAIAAEQTAPLENPSAAQCTYDVNDQEAGKKTVFHAYGVDNYMYLCYTITGSTVFVAEVKEGESASVVRCRGESGWDAEVIKAPGETHTCNGTPFLIGSVTLECGPDEGCCSPAECGHGTCANLTCVCNTGWEGATCNSPEGCADITESELYQKKGCCDC